MKLVKPTILFLALFTAVNSFAQTTKIIVSKDQKFKVETSSKVNSSAEVMGQTMETNVNNTTTTLIEVIDVDKDEIKLKSTVTQMAVHASNMGQEMNFDSDKNDNSGPMADMLAPRINKAKKIVIDPKGSVIKQEDALADDGQLAMMGLSGGDAPETELYISALIGMNAKAGDKIPVINDIRKDKYTSRDSGTYVITAIENGVASISYSGTQVVAATIEQMGMEMQTNSNNKVNSELQMDINTGLVLLKATVIEMNVSVDAGGMTIPASGKTTITTKITPL